MEIPLQAQVQCTDGVCGRSVYVLINPVTDQVAHLVVREDSSPHTEYIVPVDVVSETINDTIQLRCSKAELEKMDPFVRTTVIEEKVPGRYSGSSGGMYGMGSLYYLPYATPERTVYESMEYQQIPPGELAVRRATRVEATDGYVGHVDEFVVNPENGHITHLVMREGHLWGRTVGMELTRTDPLHPDVPHITGAVARLIQVDCQGGHCVLGIVEQLKSTRVASQLKTAKLIPPFLSWVPKGRGVPARTSVGSEISEI